MYKMESYKHGNKANEYTHKNDVLNSFYEDIKNCKPCNIVEHKNTVSVVFSDGKYTCCYLLPIRFKMYFNGELSNFVGDLLLNDDDGNIESMTEKEAAYNIKAWKSQDVEIPEGLTAQDLIHGIKYYC